jgi:branched-chain amino acid transport system substrate-binding protein
MRRYQAAQVSTPVGQKSVDWLKTLRPDFVQQAGTAL